jgi:hypothetical protein
MKAVTSALASGAITPGEGERILGGWSTPLSGRSTAAISTGVCRDSKMRPRRARRLALQVGIAPDLQPIGEWFAADLLQVQQRETIGSIFDCKSRSCHWQGGMLFAIIREGMAGDNHRGQHGAPA